MAYRQANNIIGMVHCYHMNQTGIYQYWPLLTPPTSLFDAAPVNSSGKLVATSTTPLMTLVNQFDLGHW
jgi:hypothetical protein